MKKFSKKEQQVYNIFNKKKAVRLLPQLKFLTKIGCTPDMITGIGFLCSVAFVQFFQKPFLASFFLIAHLYADTLDGALARFQRMNNWYGTLLDFTVDIMGMFLIVGSFWWQGNIPQIVFISVMTSSVMLYAVSWWRAFHNIPAKFSFHPRLWVYSFVILELFGLPLLLPALVLITIVNGIQIIAAIPRMIKEVQK